MAFPAVTTASPGNIKTAEIMAVYVYESTSSKYQTLGAISQGQLNITDFSSDDSQGRNRTSNVWNFTAKCRMLQTSLVELELLDSLTAGTNDFLFKLSDAETVTVSAAYGGWVKVTAAQVGVKAKLICDGTPQDERYIELEWQGSIYISSANQIALLTPTLAATSFCSSAESGSAIFYGIGIYTAATDGGSPNYASKRSCGVSTLTYDNAGGSSPVTMSPITNIKLSFEQIATEDSLRRFLPNVMQITADIDWLATDKADTLLLDNMLPIAIKATITMIDGVVFTLDDVVGMGLNYETLGDMDKPRVVRFHHTGKILNSQFDGIVA